LEIATLDEISPGRQVANDLSFRGNILSRLELDASLSQVRSDVSIGESHGLERLDNLANGLAPEVPGG
jgi:hypothetical protein